MPHRLIYLTAAVLAGQLCGCAPVRDRLVEDVRLHPESPIVEVTLRLPAGEQPSRRIRLELADPAIREALLELVERMQPQLGDTPHAALAAELIIIRRRGDIERVMFLRDDARITDQHGSSRGERLAYDTALLARLSELATREPREGRSVVAEILEEPLRNGP